MDMKSYAADEAVAYGATRSTWPEVLDCFYRYIHSANFLDAGCGTGNDLYAIYKKTGYAGFACDYSIDMIAQARQKVPDAIFRQANLDNEFPFDRRFELIYMHDVIHHLAHPEVCIQNAYDHLSPGGMFIIGSEFQEGLKEKFTSEYFPNAYVLDMARYRAKRDIVKLLKNAGFVIDEDISIDDTEPFTPQILEQARTRSHSILRLISHDDFMVGLQKLERDVAAGILDRIKRSYTLLVARKI